MDPKEYHLSKLKDLQTELISTNKRKVLLVELIKKQSIIVDSLSEPKIKYVNPNADLICRDVDICIAYIAKHGKVPSRELVDHLNIELEDQFVRWPIKRGNKKIDSSLFSSRMAIYLKEHHTIGYCTENLPGTQRKSTFWYLK